MAVTTRPAVLVILDGWGYREDVDFNAIHAARKPVWDRLWKEHPHTLINTSGAAVGLPGDQMGNSEVGHLNLGAGRVVYQEFTRVSRAIRTGSFFSNQTLTGAVDKAIAEVGATGIRDMGKVMGALKAKYTGRMDFGKAGPMVKDRLG